jgi:hypothetical protein
MSDTGSNMAKAGKVPDNLEKGGSTEDGDLDALEEQRGGELLQSLAGAREASQGGEVFERDLLPGRIRVMRRR